MEILNPNRIKLRLDEGIFELVSLIKPTHEGDVCKFLEGPLWAERKGYYDDKLVNRTYWVINHHLYVIRKVEATRAQATFLRVSGRGNINEVTREDALEVVNTRTGYIEDSALAELPPDDDPQIPYNTVNCDF